MLVIPENWEDGDKYFRGCFIKVKEYGDTLVQIDKVTSQALFGKDQYGEDICIEIDGSTTGNPGYNINYVIPKKAYFQWGDRAYFLSRIPARMWKKGINKENTKVLALRDDGTFSSTSLSFQILSGYVNKPGYLSFDLFENYDSIALSPRFAMTVNGNIFLDNICIGKYYKAANKVIVRALFKSEISKLFPGVSIAKA